MSAKPNVCIRKIVSGGQTGVDRAALDYALERGIACGGWCPLGRRAEDGPISGRYPLIETPSPDYAIRTRWNVRDSDGTLILAPHPLRGGTKLTWKFAQAIGKPVLVLSSERAEEGVDAFDTWRSEQGIETLNVAGPRASEHNNVYVFAWKWLDVLLHKKGDSL